MAEPDQDSGTRYTLDSQGFTLVGHLARPERVGYSGSPGLVICHGFPTPSNGSLNAGKSYYELADRIANRLGWFVLAIAYRGCGESEGQFSLQGWLEDVKVASSELEAMPEVNGVWIAGFGTGGVLGMQAAVELDHVMGVASVAPPADFDDWAQDPEGLVEYARAVGAVSEPDFPEDIMDWSLPLTKYKGITAAGAMSPKPLLVLHGAEDDVVPVFDARVIADAHGAADLRIIGGAGHRLRFDPRAVAILMGWLERAGLPPEPDQLALDNDDEEDRPSDT